jgi:hypothetical protein
MCMPVYSMPKPPPPYPPLPSAVPEAPSQAIKAPSNPPPAANRYNYRRRGDDYNEEAFGMGWLFGSMF